MIELHNEDCLIGMSRISDRSVDLVIADPPYFKVVGERWDYQWRTENEYLEWCDRWFGEVSRIVRYGGTFYLFGYFRTLAHLLPILERHGFSLRQQIIVDKGMRAVSGRATANYRMYPCVTESILFMIKDPIPFSRTLLKEHQISAGLSSSDINKALGVKTEGGGMWSIYSGNNVCEQLPTREQWDVLQRTLGFECPYDSICPVFNTEMGITDVWRDIDFYSEKRMHPTQKPVRLIKRLIRVSSNEGDLVLDPFMGSGTVGAVAKALGRDFIGYEIDKDYFVRCSERIDNQGGLSGFLEGVK